MAILNIQKDQLVIHLSEYLNKRIDLVKIEQDFNSILNTKHNSKTENFQKARVLNTLFLQIHKLKTEYKHLFCGKYLADYRDRLAKKKM